MIWICLFFGNISVVGPGDPESVTDAGTLISFSFQNEMTCFSWFSLQGESSQGTKTEDQLFFSCLHGHKSRSSRSDYW